MLDLSFDLCRFGQEAKNAEKHSILGVFSSNFVRKLKPKYSHGGGLRWPTLKPKLACWAIPEAKKYRKTQCFEHFSKFSLVS